MLSQFLLTVFLAIAPALNEAAAPCLLFDTKYNPHNMAGQGRSTENSPQDCQKRCGRTSGCAHFSFWPDGGCHLQDDKAKMDTWWFAHGVIAGPKKCPDLSPRVKARANDVAVDYFLKENGDLFRTVNGHPCQITNNVKEAKVSLHPTDNGMIYYIREEKGEMNLYTLANAEQTGQCPKATKTKLMPNIKNTFGTYKYTVVEPIDTTIVNIALSEDGVFMAWDDKEVVVKETGVVNFLMNYNFGTKGAPFSSYVAFLINREGYIYKVKGKQPKGSKWDNKKYASVKDFMVKEKLAPKEEL